MAYLTHPQHGATHAFETGEVDRLQQLGWTVTKEPTAAEIRRLKLGAAKARLEAELAAVSAEDEALKAEPEEVVAEPPKKRKYTRKSVAA